MLAELVAELIYISACASAHVTSVNSKGGGYFNIKIKKKKL